MNNTPCGITRRMNADKEGKPRLNSLGLITTKLRGREENAKEMKNALSRGVRKENVGL